MNPWELTNDEMKRIKEKILGITPLDLRTAQVGAVEHTIAEEAQKALIKWLHEKCYKHDGSILRLGCPECWKELRKGVGL